MVKRMLVGICCMCMAVMLSAHELRSPNGNLKINVDINADGTPIYSLRFKGKKVVSDSKLGILTEEADLTSRFRITDISTSSFDETWAPVWGEYAKVRNHYNELRLTFIQQDAHQRKMVLCFRLFDDGLGFRYELPEQQHMNYLTVKDELTQFNMTGDHLLYCIPGDYDTNEFAYATTPLSKVGSAFTDKVRKKTYEAKATGLSVQTPLMMKTSEGLYINIHEAGLIDYAAMLLNVDDKALGFSAHLTPDKLGKKGYLQLPINTPWRTIIVSDDARDILASQLIYNLNEPCKIGDTSWIKPQKFIGVWWEMFTGAGSTWAYSDYYKAKPGVTDYRQLQPNGHHPANTKRVKEYIDFAADNGIDAVLVEGWNEGWEDWASYRKNRQFLFDKPYPDFDVEELSRYAKLKGVKIIMHHETGSNAADYERQLDRAFQFMVDYGYNSVKTGYVGQIIPRSEYHSSQWMNNHYVHVVKRAADFHIMVDSHEAVRPTGLMRTWPNWVAQESARGGEFESMGGNRPDHTCILPFTRLKGGPMDYTPGIFQTKLSYYNGAKKDQAQTTLVKQLALYVTMPSPLQMAADLPENYQRFTDAFQFIKDVAVDWENSWYLEAEPGDYITVARKAKGKDEWFVGGITDENPRTATIDCGFLPRKQKFVATIYADAPGADWKNNPQKYMIYQGIVTASSVIKQHLASSGGVAVSIKVASANEVKRLRKI